MFFKLLCPKIFYDHSVSCHTRCGTPVLLYTHTHTHTHLLVVLPEHIHEQSRGTEHVASHNTIKEDRRLELDQSDTQLPLE